MADNEFVIHKVKYDEEWRYPSTKDWMVKSWNALRRHREAIAFDYQQFEPRNIVQLEELIAVNVFGVSVSYNGDLIFNFIYVLLLLL
ncbi:unnamed protein product [Heligmosomoides polygyrus]|uniref:PRELI/MSF1 domain-containing protein n=1 Tax=Heligmosomoides polygyrus TaxID=6339 RepID=A0A183GTP6_HELPZ|nr:unnamed protein product [Heligmosomoides polygyrus]